MSSAENSIEEPSPYTKYRPGYLEPSEPSSSEFASHRSLGEPNSPARRNQKSLPRAHGSAAHRALTWQLPDPWGCSGTEETRLGGRAAPPAPNCFRAQWQTIRGSPPGGYSCSARLLRPVRHAPAPIYARRRSADSRPGGGDACVRSFAPQPEVRSAAEKSEWGG